MVGESEANVRALFAEAEAEERQMGANRCVKMNIKYQIVHNIFSRFLKLCEIPLADYVCINFLR